MAQLCKPENTRSPVERIRTLNDALRQTRTGGRVVLTRGVITLGPEQASAIVNAVAAYSDFGPDNDPYGEHDFGALDVAGQRVFWKIDYYDPSLTGHSDDLADAARTVRVLTIMLAEDY